jgi:hypothetical protein
MVTSTVETVMGMPASKVIMEMRIKAQGKRDSLGILCMREGGRHA